MLAECWRLALGVPMVSWKYSLRILAKDWRQAGGQKAGGIPAAS